MEKKHTGERASPTVPAEAETAMRVTLDDQLCFAVHAASHAFHRAYKPLLERVNLTYPQYLVMLALWQRGELGVKALGEMLFLDSGTLSPLLKRLEQAGHVARRRDAQDERQVKITLTPSGAALRSEAEAISRSMLIKTGCTLEEAGGLRDQLKLLRQSLDAET